MRVAVVSANLGSYDHQAEWPALIAPAGVTVEVHRFTDENLPPRPLAMTSRLQCGIPKWFGPDLVPRADLYLWIDASCTPTECAVSWFLSHMQYPRFEMALFQHPARRTIREEYEFITARLARRGETYLTSRYRGEWLDAQFAAIEADGFADAPLFASTAFMYCTTSGVRALMKDVWYGKTRWHLHDQLYLAYAVAKSGVPAKTIEQSYLSCPALTYMRNQRRRAS